MVCIGCIAGGRANRNQDYSSAITLHATCKGDCGCQHKTGQGPFVKVESSTTTQTKSQ
jgi:hypothetical protein